MSVATKCIDLNCDMCEGYGVYHFGADEQLMKYISSANIACGFHGGDPTTIRKTIALCQEHQVAIGAHPGLPDLIGFGRRMMMITPEEAYDLMLYQVGALAAFVKAAGALLHHVKPHGALYNMAAQNGELANALVRACQDVDEQLIMYGLSGSKLIEAAQEVGMPCAQEVFVDRAYQDDGSLVPRDQQSALIANEEDAMRQALCLIEQQKVQTVHGKWVALKADTICIHGDGPFAIEFARKLHAELAHRQIKIACI